MTKIDLGLVLVLPLLIIVPILSYHIVEVVSKWDFWVLPTLFASPVLIILIIKLIIEKRNPR